MTRISRTDTDARRRHAELIRRQSAELAERQRADRAALVAAILPAPAGTDDPGPAAA